MLASRSRSHLQVDRSGDSLFFPSEQSLGYLDGTYAGDFGFDPLGLSDPEGAGGFIDPEWLRYAEIINGRWAMLGAAGMVGPEALGAMGVIPEPTRVLWFKSGVFPPAGTPEGLYSIDPWALFWIEIVLMNFAELRRWQDYNNPGSMGKQYFLGLENFLGGSGEPAYPGACTLLLHSACLPAPAAGCTTCGGPLGSLCVCVSEPSLLGADAHFQLSLGAAAGCLLHGCHHSTLLFACRSDFVCVDECCCRESVPLLHLAL